MVEIKGKNIKSQSSKVLLKVQLALSIFMVSFLKESVSKSLIKTSIRKMEESVTLWTRITTRFKTNPIGKKNSSPYLQHSEKKLLEKDLKQDITCQNTIKNFDFCLSALPDTLFLLFLATSYCYSSSSNDLFNTILL